MGWGAQTSRSPHRLSGSTLPDTSIDFALDLASQVLCGLKPQDGMNTPQNLPTCAVGNHTPRCVRVPQLTRTSLHEHQVNHENTLCGPEAIRARKYAKHKYTRIHMCAHVHMCTHMNRSGIRSAGTSSNITSSANTTTETKQDCQVSTRKGVQGGPGYAYISLKP